MNYGLVNTSRIRLGSVVWDPESYALLDAAGTVISVRKQSLRVLAELAARNGSIVSKDELIDKAWSGRMATDESLAQCIKDIRSALGDKDHSVLKTAVGRGYWLNGEPEPTKASKERPTVFVSKFRAGSIDASLLDLADVLGEELVVLMSPRAGVLVTTEPGKRQTANYVIEGRVGYWDGDIRVFVQLSSRESQKIVFAETFLFPKATASQLCREITEKIASVLRIYMFNTQGESYLERSNDQLETQELMAKAAYHMSRIQMENRDEARAAMTCALEREPTNAIVLAMRASAAVLSILQESRSKLPDSPEYCLELAERAIGLAPHLDFVNRTRGSMRLWFQADHKGARADCFRALEINPAFHLAHQTIAFSEILSGEHVSGIQRVHKIIELGTPSNPRLPHYLSFLALGELLGGNVDAALASAFEAYERAPHDPWCRYIYIAAAADRDDIVETQNFRHLTEGTDLPLHHFRDQAFTNRGDVEWLEERLTKAGYTGV